VAVLGDPHGVDDHRRLCRGEDPRGGDDLPRLQTGDGGGPLGGPVGHRRCQGSEVLAAGLDELPVLQPLGDDDLHHPVEERHVAAVSVAQVQVGVAGEADAAVVGDDEPGAAPDGVEDAGTDEGVLLGVLEPMTRITSAWSMQSMELVMAPEPKVSASPTTVEEWQSRAQWSMLLVPNTPAPASSAGSSPRWWPWPRRRT